MKGLMAEPTLSPVVRYLKILANGVADPFPSTGDPTASHLRPYLQHLEELRGAQGELTGRFLEMARIDVGWYDGAFARARRDISFFHGAAQFGSGPETYLDQVNRRAMHEAIWALQNGLADRSRVARAATWRPYLNGLYANPLTHLVLMYPGEAIAIAVAAIVLGGVICFRLSERK